MSNEQAERLLRLGYIEVKRGRPFTHELYIAGDHIDRVEGDTVYVSIACET